MFTSKDREMLGNNKRFIEHLSRSYENDNGWLQHKCDWLQKRLNCAEDMQSEIIELRTKVDLYEKFIAQMLKSDSVETTSMFMLNGEMYTLTEYDVHFDPGEPKTISAEFQCTTGYTKNFEEKDNDQT